MKISNDKGAVFVISLMVVMVLLILASVFIFRAVTEKAMADRERKLEQTFNIGESGGNAGLRQLDTLINTDMLNTVNATNPSTVSSKAVTYVGNGDGLGFLNEFVKNGGVAQLTVAGGQATYTQASTAAGNGTYNYVIKITEKTDPVTVTSSIWDFPYYYRIEATGRIGNISRDFILSGDFTVRVQHDNFAKYALFTNAQTLPDGTQVWFTNKTNFSGPLFTNGTFNFGFNPGASFSGDVAQKASTARFYNNGSNVLLNSDHNGTVDVPTFSTTFTRSSTAITLSSSVQQSDMQTQAKGTATISSNGIYIPNNGSAVTGGIYVQGDSTVALSVSGTKAVYTIQQSGTTKTITVDKTANTTQVATSSGTTTYGGLPNGVDGLGTLLYVQGKITSLAGTVQKDTQLTIASDSDMVIQNNLMYEDYTAASGTPGTVGYVPPSADGKTNLLGLVSWNGNVRVGTSAPNNVSIHASVLAKNGVFQVDNYDDTGVGSRGVATVLGGVITNYYGAFGTFNSSTGVANAGYGRNFTYDTRMADQASPPYFPTLNTFVAFTNDIADKIAWQEGDF